MTQIQNDAKPVSPLIATKLYAPRWRPGLVARPALTSRMANHRASKLTLVSAPAGFGKTTLLAGWLEEAVKSNETIAWVSLDSRDNDPALFWSYVVSSLATAGSGIGKTTTAMLQSPQPPPIETILTTLINDIASQNERFVLVMDDYHAVELPPIHEAMTFVIDHLPPNWRLVIASRSDPPLPLSRLRARGDLLEFRAAELRFSEDEAATFLTGPMALALSPHDIAALSGRTEGWIAGLQLAALSMRGRADTSDFIAEFAGDDRYIVDYLVEEVLRNQSPDARHFLLTTAILDRFSSTLCEAVSGQPGGREMLAALERGNLFIVPLDDKRRWFRYHHLFSDVLRAIAYEEYIDQIPTLHLRASVWFEQNNEPYEAIQYALTARDFDRAALLVESTATLTQQHRQEHTLLRWLQAIPPDVIRARPFLSVTYAGALLSCGHFAGVESLIEDAARWLESARRQESVSPADEKMIRLISRHIAIYRSAIALAHGAVEETIQFAREALTLIDQDDDFMLGAVSAILGLASWTRGDLDFAYASYTKGMSHLRRAGHVSDAVGGILAPTDIRITQGRLREAMTLFEQTLSLSSENASPGLRGCVDIHVGMAERHLEWNEIDRARQSLARSEELGEHLGFPQNPHRYRLALARLSFIDGDSVDALRLIEEAERRYRADMYPNLRPVNAQRARLLVRMGRISEARDWASGVDVSVHDEVDYLHEYSLVTLARILLAEYRQEHRTGSLNDAGSLIARLRVAAETGGRVGSLIEILILEALLRREANDSAGARESLFAALRLAEPEGYIRLFIDEGEPLIELLRALQPPQELRAYVARLISAASGTPTAPIAALPAANSGLIEPLSDRELDVLRLIAEGLSNRDIADRLFLALDTVKGHNRRLFAKLEVESRTEALAKARSLNLI